MQQPTQIKAARFPGGIAPTDRAVAYRIMQQFADTAKTETAFYLRFERLVPADREFLAAYYNLPDNNWAVFKQITRWWAVRTA